MFVAGCLVLALAALSGCEGGSSREPSRTIRSSAGTATDVPTPTSAGHPTSSPTATASVTDRPGPVARALARMTLRDKAGQLMVVAFSGTGAPAQLIRSLHPGGLIYFGNNLVSDSQISAMSAAAQRAARAVGPPLLITTDQEGGEITRIPGTQGVPGGEEFHGDARAARATAVSTARLMSGLGINTDLAPDADVDTVVGGIIGPRSFGSEPGVVSRLVHAQVCGYHAGGVAATAKHFPGHGSTTTDSHLRTAVVTESAETWRRVDLPPFEAAVRSGVDIILVGHLAVPALDPTGRPATISPVLNGDLLRDRLHFRGVVMTDALNMGGITSWGSSGTVAVESIRAGSDMLLMPVDPVAAVDAVVAAVRDGRLSMARLNASVERILRLKARLGLFGGQRQLTHC